MHRAGCPQNCARRQPRAAGLQRHALVRLWPTGPRSCRAGAFAEDRVAALDDQLRRRADGCARSSPSTARPAGSARDCAPRPGRPSCDGHPALRDRLDFLSSPTSPTSRHAPETVAAMFVTAQRIADSSAARWCSPARTSDVRATTLHRPAPHALDARDFVAGPRFAGRTTTTPTSYAQPHGRRARARRALAGGPRPTRPAAAADRGGVTLRTIAGATIPTRRPARQAGELLTAAFDRLRPPGVELVTQYLSTDRAPACETGAAREPAFAACGRCARWRSG